MANTITFFGPPEIPVFHLSQKEPEPSALAPNVLFNNLFLASPDATLPNLSTAIQSFKSANIPVLLPSDPAYTRATTPANLLFRSSSHPDCVVQPQSTAHVRTVIQQAKAHNLPVTIRCGFHSWAAFSTASRGILLDLAQLNAVALDAAAQTVTVDAGCSWADVYAALPDGCVVTGARAPSVGVSGFVLGGGLGPFTRRFGLGSDALVEATVVTADGEVVTVSERDDRGSDEGRLFWALRGAGGGNFGVVVQMKLRVQRLRGEEVVGGRYEWRPSEGLTDGVVGTMNEFYATNWEDGMTIDSAWVCDLRQASGDKVRFLTSFDGSKDEFDGLVDRHIEQPELAGQLKERSVSEKSTQFLGKTLDAQWTEDIERSLPENKSYNICSSFALNNDSKNIEHVTAIVRDEMKAFRSRFSGKPVEFSVTWMHAGGKAAEKNPSDTAFFWREAVYHTYVTIVWEDQEMEKDMKDFLASVKARLRPFSLKEKAAYVNFPDGEMRAERYEEAYFGDNSTELRRVKQIWDKDNFFNWSQGVKLPQSANNY
ncbi:putative FAD-linked oxidoreductase YvdP [Lasiodiplodia hormozganensis]|uniref:FAD-linked oxidoreductase YvdP n=1 Tax=Lasiodiplodia hormozganensis TaxID=869390 RepID=A0AA39XQH7_9PEZI|nr:putative FAD-linked oxidoreductase YvdP [Lasiodiplodia hormozganensis]